MKILDRFLIKEFLKYLLIALAFVVLIYLLFDLFQIIDTFVNRKTSLWIIGLYYVYTIPSYAGLLLPVGIILSSFLVVGRLTRQRELSALKSGGIDLHRLFIPFFVLGTILVPVSFFGNEFITIPANGRNQDVRIYRVEKRQRPSFQVRNNFFYYGEEGRTYFIRYFESKNSLLRNFVIWEFDPHRQIRQRFDVAEARFEHNRWLARDVVKREFGQTERLTRYPNLALTVKEKPGDFAQRERDISEMNFIQLAKYINKMHRAGERVTRELVEFHFRFSYPFVGLIVLLLALPLASSLRRGGVMLGLGMGLLLSFSYWGAIQTAKAFGLAGIISPGVAAWIPNIFFGALGFLFLSRIQR